jgi:hypothetical protein
MPSISRRLGAVNVAADDAVHGRRRRASRADRRLEVADSGPPVLATHAGMKHHDP